MLLINLLNTLNPKFCSLAVAFSIHMQLTCHISICVQALTPKLNLCPLPALISRLVTLTIPTHQWGCNSQHYQLSHSCSEPKQPSLPETNPLKGMSDVSKPVLAVRVRIGPPGPNHAPFTAKPSSHHVHSNLQVTPPTFPCPMQNLGASAHRLSFLHSVQYDVIKTIRFNRFLIQR